MILADSASPDHGHVENGPSAPGHGQIPPTRLTAAQRIAKNAAVPTVANLINRGLDFGFAIVMLRVLGPTEVGRYTWAVLVVGYFDILINFGLAVLITRDVARDPGAAGRYLGGALVVRGAMWAGAMAISALIAGPLASTIGIADEVRLTLLLLTLGIGVSNASGIAGALFNAAERMEVPALVTIFTSAMKVVSGVVVLAAGLGIVGIGAVSVGVNLATAAVLAALFVRLVGTPHPTVSFSSARAMVQDSYPLMINNLLATLFFRVDGLILRAMAGDAALGWYGSAYKFIDGIGTIPANVTLALFPILSRISDGSTGPTAHPSAEMSRIVEIALKALLSIAFPISVGATLLAEPLIRGFAGEQYLPHAAIALRILVWYAPFGFVNSLLQYVLIAANRQRFITVAFFGAALFNAVVNLFAVSRWSYVGAAIVTVASEVLLLTLFLVALRTRIRVQGALRQGWRPLVAAGIMAPVVWLVGNGSIGFAVLSGAVMYSLALVALGGVRKDELELIRQAIPLGALPARQGTGARD